ncbi:MAG: class I SAM-dependent methyltransferase, partial [Planctomycetes bacterium]|nr:class I SAM-dependent methyltransferase [Planctomycetota bacterium]
MNDAHDAAKSYDAVPYESRPLRPTHPDNLAVQAALVALAAPEVETCRVLEIGCATGGNLLPMAVGLPRGRFVGVDVSPAQIEAARRAQRELGVQNVDWIAGDVTAVAFAPASFDYVVCHGVWSWVPEPVQQAILAVIARVLSPDGIAYLSYNTYPGWHLRSMVRDMLLYRTRGIDEPGPRVRAAREFVNLLHERARDRDSAFVKFLGEEARLLGG